MPVWYGTIPIVCDGREIVMQNYTEEEAAILCGFIGRYVDRDSTYDTVRTSYSAVQRIGTAYFDVSRLPMGRAGASIPEAPMVDGAGRLPCAGRTFAENAIIDPGNTINLNGRAAIQLPAHF